MALLKYSRLKNGLPILLAPMSGTATTTVLTMVKAGSRLETKNQQGLSHLLEHMLFKGSKNYPTARDLTQVLDSVGAEYNAFTGKEYTGYYIKTAAQHLPLALKVQADMITRPIFESAELVKEKKVVAEEINMYQDNPIMFIGDVLEQELFKGSSLAPLVSGSKESVNDLNRRQLVNYWQTNYNPRNMVVVVAGRLPSNLKKMLADNLNHLSAQGKKVVYNNFKPNYSSPRWSVNYKETAQVQLALGFPSVGAGHKLLPAVKLLSVIMGGNMSSRLFMRLREQEGLCYSIRTDLERYHNTGVFAIMAGLDKSRLSKALTLIKEELELVLKKGVSQAELNKAKEYGKGSITLLMENSARQAEWSAHQYLLENSLKTWPDYLREFDAVTTMDIKRAAFKIIDFKRLTLALIGPFKSSQKMLKYFV
ncbi:insulinase family protein [Patescibacteria group bacterium]|nr:insulinase family protein [Patescibacteria group bacterium]